jgi:hypothetical protein
LTKNVPRITSGASCASSIITWLTLPRTKFYQAAIGVELLLRLGLYWW